MSLTPKQEQFCVEYLVDYNATQAAIRAGYDGNNIRKTASALKANPAIRERLAVLIAERNQRTLVAEEYIIDSLIEVITRCLQGEPVQTWDAKTQAWIPTGEWKFDPANAIKALDVLAKYIGMNLKQRVLDAKDAIQAHQGMSKEQFQTLITAVRANAAVPHPGK